MTCDPSPVMVGIETHLDVLEVDDGGGACDPSPVMVGIETGPQSLQGQHMRYQPATLAP